MRGEGSEGKNWYWYVGDMVVVRSRRRNNTVVQPKVEVGPGRGG
jgi:hypothetical protein